jgi:hypothetical protein
VGGGYAEVAVHDGGSAIDTAVDVDLLVESGAVPALFGIKIGVAVFIGLNQDMRNGT